MPYHSPVLYDIRYVICCKCLNKQIHVCLLSSSVYFYKAHVSSDVKWYKIKTMSHFSYNWYQTVTEQLLWPFVSTRALFCSISDLIQKITLLIKRIEFDLPNHLIIRYNLGHTLKNSKHADIKERQRVVVPQIGRVVI